MLLSIIIPHYNLEEWLLRRCLDSILEQLTDDTTYEVIIVDDGSERSPLSVINSYGKNNLILLTQPHLRQGAARNLGFDHSHGEYILFVDADDYLFENTLPLLLCRIKENSCDILAFNHCKCYTAQREKIKQPTTIHYSVPLNGNDYMTAHNIYGAPWHYLFRRTLCEENHLRFTEGIYLEDEVFTTLLFFKAKQIIHTNLITYGYYQRLSSTVLNQNPRHRKLLIEYHLDIITNLQKIYLAINDKLQTTGLSKKITFLTIDFIIRILQEENWNAYITRYLPLLREKKLYPLASKEKYSNKYILFSYLANHKAGLYLLRAVLKYKQKK